MNLRGFTISLLLTVTALSIFFPSISETTPSQLTPAQKISACALKINDALPGGEMIGATPFTFDGGVIVIITDYNGTFIRNETCN